jgi:peptidoglycan/xylan/chitin deacetylase (PgdA/CDA1 family)
MFHSVSECHNPFVKGPSDIWVSTVRFNKHLCYLRKYYRIISLRELVESLEQGLTPNSSVVITFDDGFADNYHFAYPLLQKYRIPATVFLSTEAIDNHNPIWIQKLNYLVNQFGIDRVVARVVGLSDSPKFEPLAHQGNSKNVLHKQLENFLAYSVTKRRREEMITRLIADFDIKLDNLFCQNKVFLSWDEIKDMSNGNISFGNHGESHTPISVLPEKDQKSEIFESKKKIEQYLEQDFLPFAYPFGQKRDYTRNSTCMINEAGHSCVLTAMPTIIDHTTSRNDLGRIFVGNIPVYRLAYELERGIIKSWLKNNSAIGFFKR